MEYGLKQEGIDVFVRDLNGNEIENYDKYLIDASMKARVVILSVRGFLVRKFMLAALALGMTAGEYVFLDVEIFQVSRHFMIEMVVLSSRKTTDLSRSG